MSFVVCGGIGFLASSELYLVVFSRYPNRGIFVLYLFGMTIYVGCVVIGHAIVLRRIVTSNFTAIAIGVVFGVGSMLFGVCAPMLVATLFQI